jgi:hypothetical protein
MGFDQHSSKFLWLSEELKRTSSIWRSGKTDIIKPNNVGNKTKMARFHTPVPASSSTMRQSHAQISSLGDCQSKSATPLYRLERQCMVWGKVVAGPLSNASPRRLRRNRYHRLLSANSAGQLRHLAAERYPGTTTSDLPHSVCSTRLRLVAELCRKLALSGST